MRRSPRASELLALGAALLTFGAAEAQDPPHWEGELTQIDCTSQCHVTHQAAGAGLTQAAGNVNLCQSCHVTGGLAEDLPISNDDKAVRGVSGTSHAFDVPAIQDFDGDAVDDVLRPLDTEMDLRVMGNNVVCSTCHDQHKSVSTRGGTPRVGNAVKVLPAVPAGTGTLVAAGTYTGPEGVWYLIEIVATGDDSTAEFCYSKDNGISWRPTGCDPPTGDFTPSQQARNSPPVALDDGAGVELAFTGAAADAFKQGERWELSAAWPFLRADLDDGGTGVGSVMCRDCHRPWVMTAVDTWNNGSVKSHPTGIAMPTSDPDFNWPPLDGNGLAQNAPPGLTDVDGIPSNDLGFDGNVNVQCLTCHGVHFVDSNTQTEDGS